MITLRTFIEQEHLRINAALAEAAAELPVSIMPIAQYAMGNGGKQIGRAALADRTRGPSARLCR